MPGFPGQSDFVFGIANLGYSTAKQCGIVSAVARKFEKA
jgi:hypothetical protein